MNKGSQVGLLWLYRSICVGPGRNPKLMVFSCRKIIMSDYRLLLIDIKLSEYLPVIKLHEQNKTGIKITLGVVI